MTDKDRGVYREFEGKHELAISLLEEKKKKTQKEKSSLHVK